MNFVLDAIANLRPSAEWGMTGDTIYWLDAKQTQPTPEEIAAEVLRLEAAYPHKVVQQQRAAAYAAESDPLFFKAQAGEVDEAEWLAKREEIRARFPYPTEVTP
jgi:hypothetical protein